MDNSQGNVIAVDFSKGKRKPTDDAVKDVSPLNLEKRRVFEELLAFGIVSVAFDPRAVGVEIPVQHRMLNHMVLNFSYGYRIPDFAFDDHGVKATLTFPEGYFCCKVPWKSVFSLHSDKLEKSSYWPETPPSLPHLTLVENASDATESD